MRREFLLPFFSTTQSVCEKEQFTDCHDYTDPLNKRNISITCVQRLYITMNQLSYHIHHIIYIFSRFIRFYRFKDLFFMFLVYEENNSKLIPFPFTRAKEGTKQKL